MHATLSATAVTRHQFEIRLAVLLTAVLIGGALAAMVFRADARPATISAAGSSATAEAYSAQLLAMDKTLFSVVAAPDSAAAYSARLLDLNNIFYPSETVAANIAASEHARLFDLNNIFYPSESNSANAASALSAP